MSAVSVASALLLSVVALALWPADFFFSYFSSRFLLLIHPNISLDWLLRVVRFPSRVALSIYRHCFVSVNLHLFEPCTERNCLIFFFSWRGSESNNKHPDVVRAAVYCPMPALHAMQCFSKAHFCLSDEKNNLCERL